MKPFLQTKDFSVSGEAFELLHNEELDMLVTRPQPEDLAPYYRSNSYISHTDSSKTLIEKMYQTVKRFSLWRKTRLINTYASGNKRLLDFGAGTGDFLIAAKKSGWYVEGVEPNWDARLRSREKKMELCASIDGLPKTRFQVITLWHVLEHLPDLEGQIISFKQLLEEDGTLVVAVPNFRSYDAEYYKEYWAAFDVPRHLWHFSRTAIERVFENHDMKVIKMRPMIFDAFYVSLLSEKYKSGKSNFLRAFFIGIISNFKGWLTQEHSSIIYVLEKTK